MGPAEVAQLYVAYPPAAGEPPLVLRAYRKTPLLAPGASALLVLSLAPRDLSVWDASSSGWQGVSGAFGVRVGSSSRDVRLSATLQATFS